MEDDAARTRKSTLKACYRCHRRKQRCVGYPSCTNCAAANLFCQRTPATVSQRYAVLSKQELIDRLVALESQLIAERDKSSTAITATGEAPERTMSDSSPGPKEERIAQPRSDIDSGDYYQPLSSGQPPDAELEKAPPPDDETGVKLLLGYLESLHHRAPFIDLEEILAIHKSRHEPLQADATFKNQRFKLYMVYAIGATAIEDTDNTVPCRPARYVAAALEFKPLADQITHVQELEAIMLVIYYKLRLALDASVWHLISHAMRRAVDAGMHRAQYYAFLDDKTAHLRTSLFWCIFVLERRICWALRRPFCVSDEAIDAKVPYELVTRKYLCRQPDGTLICRDEPKNRPTLSAASAGLHLARISSPLFGMVHRVDRPLAELKNDLPGVLEQVEVFNSIIPAVEGTDRAWVALHYNDAIRKLIETFLEVLDPHDPLMQRCLEASGRVCQLFSRMRTRTFVYTFLMVNTFFISGLTICYILFKSPLLWSPTVANDLRTCFSTLSVMAEKKPNLTKYRNIMDDVINSTMVHVQQAEPRPAEICPCSHCRGEVADQPNARGRCTYNQLKVTFRRLNFEFVESLAESPDITTPQPPGWPQSTSISLSTSPASSQPYGSDGQPGSSADTTDTPTSRRQTVSLSNESQHLSDLFGPYKWHIGKFSTDMSEGTDTSSSADTPGSKEADRTAGDQSDTPPVQPSKADYWMNRWGAQAS